MMLGSSNRPITSTFKASVLLAMSSYFLLACSKDTPIISDYKLYDLDGSNQAIIGNQGMVSVSDVTAYDIDGKRIVFETGAIDRNGDETSGQKLRSCWYGFIDTTNNVVVRAKRNSRVHHDIINRLKLARNAAVSRSCIELD
jgi:hypothetical protein